MDITYLETNEIKAEDVSKVFLASGINRPSQDLDRLNRMIKNADIIITAWDGDKLIGIARALTDYAYCCYLSDLAVDTVYQKRGIGRELINRVREKIGEESNLVLISAPNAEEYYLKLGLMKTDKAFLIGRKK